MAQIVQRLKDSGGTSYIEYYATPSYTRNGSKVTVSIRCSLYGWGYVALAYLDGVELARQPDSGTVITKTFTYDNAAAKTYSYEMKARLQTAKEYQSYYYTETVSIDVPAYVPPAIEPFPGIPTYSRVAGAWKENDNAYIKVGGVWKEAQTFVKNRGVWKPRILYNVSDQCEGFTGGWIQTTVTTLWGDSSKAAATMSSNGMVFPSATSIMTTNWQIDLTSFDHLCITVPASSRQITVSVMKDIGGEMGYKNSNVLAQTNIDYASDKSSLDISTISDSCYIVIGVGSTYTATVGQVWLE